jgi:hypothetical protein
MNGHTDDSFVQSPTSNELVIARPMPIFILLFFIGFTFIDCLFDNQSI